MRTVSLPKRILAAAAAALLFSGCGGKTLTPATYEQFYDEFVSGGYCSSGEGLTSDSEDGTSAIMQADNGWLAGFYLCADDEVAENEFDYECAQAGIESFKDGKNYSAADKLSEEEYLLYFRVDNTCLFMRGDPEDAKEMKSFAAGLGYSK